MSIIYSPNLFKIKKERKTAITIFCNNLSTPDFFQPHEIVIFRTKYPLQKQNMVLRSESRLCW